jgi:hypothetical protein
MKETDVHSLILEKTDEIEDDELRSFINEILRFERSKLDRENYQYSDKYKELIDEHALSDEEEKESTDE